MIAISAVAVACIHLKGASLSAPQQHVTLVSANASTESTASMSDMTAFRADVAAFGAVR